MCHCYCFRGCLLRQEITSILTPISIFWTEATSKHQSNVSYGKLYKKIPNSFNFGDIIYKSFRFSHTHTHTRSGALTTTQDPFLTSASHRCYILLEQKILRKFFSAFHRHSQKLQFYTLTWGFFRSGLFTIVLSNQLKVLVRRGEKKEPGKNISTRSTHTKMEEKDEAAEEESIFSLNGVVLSMFALHSLR